MLRAHRIALAAALALAAPIAAAQWRPEPMTVWLDRAGEQVLLGRFAAATAGDDVLQLYGTSSASIRPWHDLLGQTAEFGFPLTVPGRTFRAAYLDQNGADGIADVVSQSTPGIEFVYGSDPQVVHSCALSPTAYTSQYEPFIASPVKLLRRAAGAAGRPDTIVLPYWLWDVPRRIYLVDVGTGAVPACSQRVLPVPYLNLSPEEPAAYGLRLSATAIANEVDDLAVAIYGGVLLYVQRSVPEVPDLASLDLSDPILVGTIFQGATYHPWWLPDTIPGLAYAHGIAALDVNLDGHVDLVFTLSSNLDNFTGEIVWVEGTGDPYDFANPALTPWHDLGIHPALQLQDPLLVRPLDVGGERAVAIWDRDLEEVLVVRAGAAPGDLDVWRAPAPGRRAKDIRLADLVGSPEKDLVVTMDNAPLPDTLLVYPAGSQLPALSWATGSPTLLRGIPHAMAVELEAAGSASITVDWVEGAPTNAPVGQGLSHVFTGACTLPPPQLFVLVRATDDTGVVTELAATVPTTSLQTAISLRGATASGRLVLEPDTATVAVFEGVAATVCDTPTWGGAWPATAVVSDASGPDWARRTVTLPAAAYPELLSDPSLAVSLATTDPGVAEPVVTLPLRLDGSKLVEVIHESDRAALAEGEVAVLRTRLRSRIGCALPRVRVVDVLAGLAPAGAPSVSGAAVLSLGAAGAEILIDALPAAPAEVTIELPVRSAGGQVGSAVEAWSEGGWPLTPPAQAKAADALPGCGCGADGGGGGLAALALLLARRRLLRPT